MFSGMGLRKVLIVSEKNWLTNHFMLERLLSRSGGLQREYFFFASLDTPNLVNLAREHDIQAVVGLGEPVLRRLIGEKDILRWRGRVLDFFGKPFIPTFAPHKLLPENPNAAQIALLKAQGITMLVNPPRFQGTFMLDLEFALQVAKEGFTRKQANYLVDPTPSEFDDWAEGYFKVAPYAPYLSWDLETKYTAKKKHEDEFEEADMDVAEGSILRISFSYEEYTGVSVVWEPRFMATIKRLITANYPKLGWNVHGFDTPVMETVGGIPVGGEVFDGQDAWHVYQSDLPKGLEYVSSYTSDLLPWKHLNYSDPGLYSAIDADAALRNMNWIEKKLKSTNQWRLFYFLYHKTMVPLGAANKRGNFIDIAKRDELREELNRLIAKEVEEIQPLVPFVLKPRKRYKRDPIDRDLPMLVTGDPEVMVQGDRTFQRVFAQAPVKVCSICNARDITKGEHFKNIQGPAKLDKLGLPRVNKKGLPMFESLKNPCQEAGGVVLEQELEVTEWDEILPFNPNSSDQMKTYARHFGHPIGTDARDSTKETMDKSHMKELIAKYGDKHPLYEKAALLSKMVKTAGTYIYDPDENGLIHQTYKNAPTTPRLSGANKNLMNVGKREENYWAVRAREQIVARPGHRFIQADSSAIEAVVQGYLMGDRRFMELATQSVHAWLVAQKYGLEWTGSPENVEYLKANYKDAYNRMKTTVYLTNFGGGPYLMWKTDRKSFPTKEIAQATQDELFARLPKLKEYHHSVRVRAQKESFLEIPYWHARHAFYDVFTTDSHSGKLKFGKDAKRVVAFGPQGSAALFLRENTLLYAYGDEAAEWLDIEPLGLKRGYMEYMPANFAVHDGVTLEAPDGMEDELVDVHERILTRPIKFLEGLRIGCEIDVSPVGGNWGSFHEKKNPQGLKLVKAVRVPLPDFANDLRLAA